MRFRRERLTPRGRLGGRVEHVPFCMSDLRCEMGQIQSRELTQPGDVPGWRTSEEAAVFPAELRSALIPYFPARGARVRHRG